MTIKNSSIFDYIQIRQHSDLCKEMLLLLKYQLKFIFITQILFSFTKFPAQNENAIWYFGNQAGIDFTSSPPTALNNGSISSVEASASVADAQGNLLFYTDGQTIWNRVHQIMNNGSNLNGNPSSSQGALIIKQPGSPNNYYVFTLAPTFGVAGLCYSIVDMNLAAGNGSITIKNATLSSNCSEKMAATKHCNGQDYWIVVHDSTSKFQSFLLTSLGVNASPIISTTGLYYGQYGYQGNFKFSPTGLKMAAATTGIDSLNFLFGAFELFDFNPLTGSINNSIILAKGYPRYNYAYGVEFSPNGSKLYGTRINSVNENEILQWDLCSTNTLSIPSTIQTIAQPLDGPGSIQLGIDGKIYISIYNTNALDVINNPNGWGFTCGYTSAGILLGSGQCQYGLPNLVKSINGQSTNSIVIANTCNMFSFSVTGQSNQYSCSDGTLSTKSIIWDFGDETISNNNFNAQHTYTSPGYYTVTAIIQYGCYADTLRKKISAPLCTNLEDQHLVLNKISIAPNPCNDVVSLHAAQPIKFQITDSYGKLILFENQQQRDHTIDVGSWSQGIYFLTAFFEDRHSQHQKLVVE